MSARSSVTLTGKFEITTLAACSCFMETHTHTHTDSHLHSCYLLTANGKKRDTHTPSWHIAFTAFLTPMRLCARSHTHTHTHAWILRYEPMTHPSSMRHAVIPPAWGIWGRRSPDVYFVGEPCATSLSVCVCLCVFLCVCVCVFHTSPDMAAWVLLALFWPVIRNHFLHSISFFILTQMLR